MKDEHNSNVYEFALALCNPNFGDHPGPFTRANSAGYPLMQFSPGLVGLGYCKWSHSFTKSTYISFSYAKEYWKNISPIPPEFRNRIDVLDALPLLDDELFHLSYELNVTQLKAKFMVEVWASINDENSNGIILSTKYLPK